MRAPVRSSPSITAECFRTSLRSFFSCLLMQRKKREKRRRKGDEKWGAKIERERERPRGGVGEDEMERTIIGLIFSKLQYLKKHTAKTQQYSQLHASSNQLVIWRHPAAQPVEFERRNCDGGEGEAYKGEVESG